MLKKTLSQPLALFSYLCSLILFAAAYLRIYYGVDFSDEGQSIGWLYGPLIGFKPFANDFFVQQTANLPFVPLAYVYNKLMGNEGIVLFARHLFILTSLASSFCVYILSQRFMTKPLAVLLAATTFSYIPFCNPFLYYNNMAYVCLTGGLFLGAAAALEKSGKKFFLTGILFGLGVFSYPTLAAAGAVFYIGMLLHLRKNETEKYAPLMKKLSYGMFIPLAAGGLLLLSFGIETLKESFEFSKAYNSVGGMNKLNWIKIRFIGTSPDFWKISALFMLGFVCHAFRLFAFQWVFFLLPLIATGDSNSPFANGNLFSAHSLILFLPLIVYFGLRRRLSFEMGQIILVSLVAGLFMAWSSGNGFPNMGIGAYPGVIACVIVFALLVGGNEKRFRFGEKQAGIFIILICLSFGGFMTYSNYSAFYRDDGFSSLDTRVKGGPFAGLVTTGERAKFIKQVQDDVDEFRDAGKSVLFYDHFPAGYLFSDLKPMTRNLFVQPGHLRAMYAEFYARPENLPDIVFEFYAVRFKQRLVVLFNPPSEVAENRRLGNFLQENIRNGGKIYPLVQQRRGDIWDNEFRNFFTTRRSDYKVVKRRLFYRVLVRDKSQDPL